MSSDGHTANLMSPADLLPMLDALTAQLGWSSKTRFQIELALEELVVNTFMHGKTAQHGPHNPIAVRVSVTQTGQEVEIVLHDNGAPFDPSGFAEPDLTSCAEDRPVGGLGLFLTSKMMDEVHYQRLGDHNAVVLRKRTGTDTP